MAMEDFMILIQPWAVYVKTRSLFRSQGGHRMLWGRGWRPVRASSIEAARNKGKRMYRMEGGKRVRFQESEVI